MLLATAADSPWPSSRLDCAPSKLSGSGQSIHIIRGIGKCVHKLGGRESRGGGGTRRDAGGGEEVGMRRGRGNKERGGGGQRVGGKGEMERGEGAVGGLGMR